MHAPVLIYAVCVYDCVCMYTNTGTGLGLSIVSKILKNMNASVMVESTVGAGSRFYFNLTLKKTTDAEKLVQHTRTKSHDTTIIHYQKDSPLFNIKKLDDYHQHINHHRSVDVNHDINPSARHPNTTPHQGEHKSARFSLITTDTNASVSDAAHTLRAADAEIDGAAIKIAVTGASHNNFASPSPTPSVDADTALPLLSHHHPASSLSSIASPPGSHSPLPMMPSPNATTSPAPQLVECSSTQPKSPTSTKKKGSHSLGVGSNGHTPSPKTLHNKKLAASTAVGANTAGDFILLVDDSPINLKILIRMLSGNVKYDIRTATNGQEAVDLIRSVIHTTHAPPEPAHHDDACTTAVNNVRPSSRCVCILMDLMVTLECSLHALVCEQV